MLNINDYERVKKSFIDSQRLFTKLRDVVFNAANMEYDGSGFYLDAEDMYKRHRVKLISKILDGLCATLDEYIVQLVTSNDMTLSELTFNLNINDVTSFIKVDFSQEDSLNIIQLS